jgi:hypothetical protein
LERQFRLGKNVHGDPRETNRGRLQG